MASARARQAFRDDESDEDSSHQPASHRLARRKLDSSGDEGSTRQAALQRRPLTSVGGRLKQGGSLRPDETGDLRPTTPPAGATSRSRQADWASAVLQMFQNSALIAGQTLPSADVQTRPGTGSVSSKGSRRGTAAVGGSSQYRASAPLPSTSSAKAAAARKLDSSSSEDDETNAVKAHPPALLQTSTSAGPNDLKTQAQPTSEARGSRSSRAMTSSSIGVAAPADLTSASSSRLTSSAGRAPAGAAVGAASGGFAAAAAAAFEGLQAHVAQSAAYRQQQRASRLRRVSGNDSVASEISHPESLASSKQTLGSSRLSATVQRVVARQRLLDSSSGEEEGDPVPQGQPLDSDVGQAARLLARFKSLSSSVTASGLTPVGTPPSPPGGRGASANIRKSPTAPVAIISTTASGKDKSRGTAGAAVTCVARPSSAVGSARVRVQPAPPESQGDRESGAFTFTAAQSGGSCASDGISPRMRQAAAAAAAEVSAAAASSLRPLPLATIVPARITSPVRPQTAPQRSRPEPQRPASLTSTEDGPGGFATAGGAAAARQAVATAPQPNPACHNSQRIATWLEQQPSLSSVGIADDIVSEYATTVTGTEVDMDHGVAVIKATKRAIGTAMEGILSGDAEPGAQRAALPADPVGASRSRMIRLTVSSDEEEDNDRGGEHGGNAAAAENRKESCKQHVIEGKEPAATSSSNQLQGDAATRPSAGNAKGAQAAPVAATAASSTAARRLEFAGTATASPRLAKELTSTFSSPSFRASESQSPMNASDGPEGFPIGVDDATLARQAPTVTVADATTAATASKQRLATTSGPSPQHRHVPAHDKGEVQHLMATATTESSSPDSLVRIGSGGGQQSKVSQVAAAARLTPNELRVMLSVLSRPNWISAAGGVSGAAAASSTLSPRPSQGGESVQSFTYSEMLQVMRAMSSSGGEGSGSPNKASAASSARDASTRATRLHKTSGKCDDASEVSRAAPRPPEYQQQQHSQQHAFHQHYQHLPRSARDLPTAHTSLEVKTSHSARSFDESSVSSLLGEHPMAAPLGREWSGSASTVSGRGYSAEEQQQQRDFAEMVRLWTRLTGRQVPAESLAETMGTGREHLSPDGSATPRSGWAGPGSVLSGGGASGSHPSAAVLAASAAAMATSAVMAAAGGAHHLHSNAYLQAAHLQPFSEPHGISSSVRLSSQDHLLAQRGGSPGTTSAKARSRLAPGSAQAGSPGDSRTTAVQPPQHQHQQDSDEAAGLAHLLGDVGPTSIQVDLVRLIRLLSAAGHADLLPAEASEATKSDLSRVVGLLCSSVDPAQGQGGSPTRNRAAVAESAAQTPAIAASPPSRQREPAAAVAAAASPAAAAASSTMDGHNAVTEASPRRRASSRRSSSDTVETGLALGRLYQSLRNLRVRDEAHQTDGGERLKVETTSGCVQTEAVTTLEATPSELPGDTGAERAQAGSAIYVPHSRAGIPPADVAKTSATGVQDSAVGPSRLSVTGAAQPVSEPLAALSSLVGKQIRVTRALKLPTGELVELEPLLALASDEAATEVHGTAGQWLQELRALNTQSTTPTWCTSPSTTDGGVQVEPSASPEAAQQQSAGPAANQCPPPDASAGSDASLCIGTDSAGGVGTCVTAAPAIPAAASHAPFPTGPNTHRLSVEGAAAAFHLRNLPIASEGGIMDAPNQEAVTAGRVGSAGGMLAYLEAADPTTATALLELVQALQLMTLHSRRRRWISDGSSTASGAYLVDPPELTSLGGSSAVATTLRYSFGTSIGPSVSQAGQASLIDLPDSVVRPPPAVQAEAASPAVKAATTGGLGAGTSGAAEGVAQPKRQTHNAALPPRPVPVGGAEPTARHLRRALRAVSGGGTVRLTPTTVRETTCGDAGAAGPSAVSGGRASPSGPVTEAAKAHIARALELLSQPALQAAEATAPAAIAAAADAELRAQEELVAALLALLAPGGATLPSIDDDSAEDRAACGDQLAAASQHSEVITLSATPAQTSCLQPFGSVATSALATTEEQPPEAKAPADSAPSPSGSPTRSSSSAPPVKPTSPLHARIQEVLAQAERASAGVSSLQVGLSPTAPEAAEVLDGVPFEQAIGFIMDGLRDFDGGPSQLARHLHLMYAPSSGGCGGVGIFYPTALDSLVSRRQTAVALGAAAVLEAAVASDGGAAVAVPEFGSEEPQPLTDAERERVQALVSEAVAAAEALARGVRREEAWNAERLGLSMEEDDSGNAQQQDELLQAHLPVPAQMPMAPMATQLPVPSLALTRASNSRSTSPAQQTRSRPMSAGSAAASSKLRFASAGSGTNPTVAATLLPQPQPSPPGSPAASASAAAVGSPRRLIQQVSALAADTMVTLLPDADVLDAEFSACSTQQRSAPVTTAGVLDLLSYGVPAGLLGVVYAPPGGVPQTFGGAMDLPEDSAVSSAVPQTVPYLPYGDLDERLLPIQSVTVGTALPLRHWSMAAAIPDAQDAGLGQTQKEPQPLLQPTSGQALSSTTRLPTFATPSAPAVRGPPDGLQPATTGGALSSAAIEAVPEPPRQANTYGGTVASGALLAAVVLESTPVDYDEHHRHDKDESSEEGWEPDMAGAARICSPESDPLEVASFAVGLAPQVQPSALVGAFIGTSSPLAGSSPAAAAVVYVPPSSPQVQQSPHVMSARTRDPSAGGVDPEVPALTAMDRFRSPRPSYSTSPYRPDSPMRPVSGAPSSPIATRTTALTGAETVSASLEVQPQQSSPWSPGSGSDARGGFPSVRLARDVLSGRRASRFAEDREAGPELLSPPSAWAVYADTGTGIEVHPESAVMETGVVEEESRARRALFAAACVEVAPELKSADEGETAAAAHAEQLLVQAAQLLLQAMQRAAEGQPEQEAAFHILAPVLQGLARCGGTDGGEGRQPGEQLSSFGSVPVPHPTIQMEMAADQVSLKNAHDRNTTALGPASTFTGMSVQLVPPQHEQQAATDAHAMPQAQQQQHLATAADLESFKEDVMAGVRSALMEIVDMIGTTVAQRTTAAIPNAAPGPAATGPESTAGDPIGEQDCCESLEGRPPLDPMMSPERSTSPYLSADLGQQEIRITRAELEAFLFGRAVLSRNAADELLGMRLREVYASAPQPLQHGDQDDSLDSCQDAVSIGSNDPRPGRDHGMGSVSSSATGTFAGGRQPVAPDTVGSRFADHQRRGQPKSRASPTRFDVLDAAEQGSGNIRFGRPGATSPPTVPRDSPLRQPLADGADFKILFRRSIEHVRGHLQPGRCPSPAPQASTMHTEDSRVPSLPRAPLPRHPSPAPAPAALAAPDAGASLSGICDVTLAAEPAPTSCTSLEATLSPAGVSPQLAQQMAAAAASADNDDDVELDAHLSGGLQPEHTDNLARCPDPAAPATQSLPLQPQAHPQAQFHVQSRSRSQPQSRRGTADSHHEVEAIGDFLAALAEPMMQVVGVLTQPGSGAGRLRPRRSVVIEEIADEHPPLRSERPSRVPGFAATTSGVHVVLGVDDEVEERDCFAGGAARGHGHGVGHSGIAQLSTPRAVSEANLSSLHLRQAALDEQQQLPVNQGAAKRGPAHVSQHPTLQVHMSRSASCTPVQRAAAVLSHTHGGGVLPINASQQQLPDQAAMQPSAPLAPVQYPQTQVNPSQALAGGLARLKMSSAPGTGPFAAEDRPLSSFMSPSEGGAAAASPPRRRTHSPGPLARQGPIQAEPSAATAATASALPAIRSIDVVASPPGTSLDELESFLRAFRTRIGTDETGDGQTPRLHPQEIQPQLVPYQQQQALACQQRPLQLAGPILPAGAGAEAAPLAVSVVGAAAGCDLTQHHMMPTGRIELPFSDADDVRRDANLTESVSVNTARRVMTGFNMFTIRATGASALAAAAAVEQTFSPRNEREQEPDLAAVLARAAQAAEPVRAGGGEVVAVAHPAAEDSGSGASGPSDASHGSSAATPTNPLLREHLEHFQALLEKANDLVDRLMLADEDLTSEGAAADPNATPSPSAGTPGSLAGSAARRQLSFKPRASSTSVTPRRQIAPALSAMAPSTPTDGDADVPMVVTPAVSALPTAPSLDPELAALFPATASRLARPYAHVEQTPDAAHSLLSSAVSAVPQLAAGADRVRSLSCTPPNRSPAASVADLRITPILSTSDGGPSAAVGAGGPGVATPLTLVAALLAEAHSRMEFRSLEEQRGADRILSAVLDEHFAHVLGTPRGFLTPQRGSTARSTLGVCAEVATLPHPAVPPPSQAPPQTQSQETPGNQLSAAGPAHVSGAFSRAFATAAQAKGPAEAAPEAGQQALQSAIGVTKPDPEPVPQLQCSPESNMPPPATVRAQQPPSPGFARGMTAGRSQQAEQQRADEMNDFLAQVMKQRSDILTSALDHVHRVSGPAGAPSPPPAMATAAAPGTSAQYARTWPPGPPISVPVPVVVRLPDLPEIVAMTRSLDIPDTGGASVDVHLPNSVIPANSDGLPLMPQPLMPYQELDSDSNPTSYSVSIAGSAFQGEALATWSRGPSPRASTVFPIEPVELQMARRVSSVAAASAGGLMPSSPGASAVSARRATSDSAVMPVAGVMTVALAAAEEQTAAEAAARVGYDLSHLIDDDDGTLSAGPSSVFRRSTLSMSAAHILDTGHDSSGLGGVRGGYQTEGEGEGETSGCVSTLRTSSTAIGSHSHVPEVPEPPHESALRYNPVYDHFGSGSAGGAVASAPFCAPAATVSVEPSGNISDGGSFAAGGGAAAAAAAGGAMTTLHHETAYTPLALAAGDGNGAVEGGGATTLHARLRSAGGTTTAVLVPNPTFDDPADSPAMAVSVTAAAVKAAAAAALKPAAAVVGGSNDSDTAQMASGRGPRSALVSDSAPTAYPRLQLEFSDFSTGGGCAGQGSATSSSSGTKAAGTALPLSPVDAMTSPTVVSAATLQGAGGASGAAEPGRASVAISDLLPRTDPGGDSAADSMDLSSLLGYSLTESQMNLLAATPELPSSSALPHNPATAHRVQRQLQLSAGGASSGSTTVGPAAVLAAMVAVTSGSVTPMDVTMSLDFEEISREAAAVAETLSAHASGEAVNPEPTAATHPSAALPAATAATEATARGAVQGVAGPEASTGATPGGDRGAAKQAALSPPAQKRHMGDVVAAAVRRFELGVDVTAAAAEVAAAPASPPDEPSDPPLPAVRPPPRRSSSSGIPRGPPSPGGAKLIVSSAVDFTSAGDSSEWQVVTLSTGGGSRQLAGAEAAETRGDALAALLSSEASRSAAEEAGALTVLTREWVPPAASQVIPEGLLDASETQVAADVPQGGNKEPAGLEQQLSEAQEPSVAAAPASSSASPAAKQLVRAVGGSPAAAGRASPARQPLRRGGGVSGSSVTPVASRTATASPGSSSTTPAAGAGAAVSRQAGARTAVGSTGTGSPGAARSSSVTSNASAMRRATQSPLRTAPASRVPRASVPGAQAEPVKSKWR